MKIKHIFILILLNGLLINAQSPHENLDKYWHYRERLKTKFMVSQNVNSGNANNYFGVNIPAARRNPTDYNLLDESNEPLTNYVKNSINWIDATCDLGYYIAVLATEYKLLDDYPQLGVANAKTQTLQELSNALWAIERLDDRAETHYGWSCTNEFEDCLNGFFIRDDVSSSFPASWAANGYPEFSNTSVVGSDFNNYESGANIYSMEKSQDQVWNLLMGFALVNKFVDVPVIGDTPSGTINYKEWAQILTNRIIRQMHAEHNILVVIPNPYFPVLIPIPIHTETWKIYNPATGEQTHRGGGFWDLLPHAYLFAEAGNWITENNYGNLHHGFEKHFTLSMPWDLNLENMNFSIPGPTFTLSIHDGFVWYKYTWFRMSLIPEFPIAPIPEVQVKHYNDKAKLLLATIAGIDYAASYDDIVSWTKTDSYYWNNILTGDNKELLFEHLPLIYLALHEENIYSTFNLTRFRRANYLSKIENLLNIAPYDGPFRFIYDVNDDHIYNPDDHPGMEWAVNNRLNSPIGKNFFEATEVGEFVGLDYMLLHNLYLLMYYQQFNVSEEFDNNFPYLTYGSQTDETPLNLSVLNDLEISGNHNSNCEIVYRAGNSITILPGFEAELGAEITFAPDGYRNLSY